MLKISRQNEREAPRSARTAIGIKALSSKGVAVDTKLISPLSLFRLQMSRTRFAVLLWLGLTLSSAESAVYISDLSMSRMIELMAKSPFCKLHIDR